MADDFADFTPGLESPATKHKQLSASASVLDPIPKVIFCQTAGTCTVEDEDGTSLSVTLPQGGYYLLRAYKVTAIASGVFYGLY